MAPVGRAGLARHPVVAGLYVGTPLFSLFVVHAPLVTTLVSGLFSLGLATAASPGTFIALTALLCTAVPKAGFVVGGLPLPLMMFMLLLGALVLRMRTGSARRYGTRLGVLALVWLLYRLVALYLDGGTPRDVAALGGWYGLPLVLLLIGPGIGNLPRALGAMWNRWLEIGMLAACGFSIVQQLVGIERSAVPGVTRAVGADYSSKPLAFEGGSKIPSTYQNGNILGVVTGFFFVISAERVLRGRGTQRDLLMMALTAVATILSGSRTAVIGLALGLGVLMVRSGLRRQTIVISALCAIVAGITLYLSPALADRLTGTTASDPALALRTEVWSQVLRETSLLEFMTGGSAWADPPSPAGLAEGLFGAVQQVGLVGMALFLGLFLIHTSPPHLRRWRLLLIPVAVSLAADSAYLVFPTLFLPIARMFGPIGSDPETDPGGSDRPQPSSHEESSPSERYAEDRGLARALPSSQ